MKHHWSIGAGSDEGKLHTFVVDYCFPSQGSQQGITLLVIKETKTKAITTFMVPNKGANEYPCQSSGGLHEGAFAVAPFSKK